MSVDQRTGALKNVWWTERDSIAIAKKSETDSSVDYVSPQEVKTITLHFTKYDEDFVSNPLGVSPGMGMVESPSIPSEFHEALANYAIAKGYELKPELIKMAPYFKSLFNDDVREGKKYANKGRDGTAYTIIGSDF